MRVRRNGVLETQNVAIVEEDGVTPLVDKKTSVGLAPGGSAVLQHPVIAANRSGRLQSVTISSEIAWQATIQKFDGISTSDIVVLYGLPGKTESYIPADPRAALHGMASTGISRFQVVITNNSAPYSTSISPIHITTEYDEFDTI